jgi:hypothetical protein
MEERSANSQRSDESVLKAIVEVAMCARGRALGLQPPAKRVSGVLGMFSCLEVKVLYPT